MFEKRRILARSAGFSVAIFAMAFAIPAAMAANSIVNNIAISPDPFHTQVPGHESQSKVFITYDWDAGGYNTGDVTEVIKDGNNNVVYYWGATEGADARADAHAAQSETISLEWDGKGNTGTYNGQYVPDGTYTFDVLSHVATPPDTEKTKTFVLAKSIAPAVSWVSQPGAVYYTGSGSYTVNYSLVKNTAISSVVRLTINGPQNNNPQDVVVAELKNADGNYTMSWDGKINGSTAPAGQYTYSLQPEGSIDGFGALGNSLTGSFTVNNGTAPQPVLSGVSATPNPFDPNAGNINFSYTLAGSTGNSTIMAAVYKSGDNTAVATWTFGSQSSGSNSVLWSGKDSNSKVTADGAYIFKVWGNDGSFQIIPMQTSFTVAAKALPDPTPVPSDKCAGYTDINKSDSDCAAFTYLQGLGAMTGNPDGTFAPGQVLQRDQVTKIILVTFNKFNANSNYCNSGNPFPDVTSNAWSYQYICRGVGLGMITGYKSGIDAGFYRPDRGVSRVEFLALLLRNLSDSMPSNSIPSFSDVEINQWFSGYARYALDNDLFSGSKLYPTASTTRREVAEIIYKLHQAGKV